MSKWTHEDAMQAPNSVRTVYTLANAYQPGSLRIWRNGQLQTKDHIGDGWTELPPKKVRFNNPPVTGDDIIFGYRLQL